MFAPKALARACVASRLLQTFSFDFPGPAVIGLYIRFGRKRGGYVIRIFLGVVMLFVMQTTFAASSIIEGFEDFSDPANWQLTAAGTPPNHTLNATVSGSVPQFVTSGSANMAGRFNATWNLTAPSVASENIYDSAGPNLYFAARYNVNAPSSLPNNAIPTASGLLQADVVNRNTYPVKVALVVTGASSSQLERGPLVEIPAESGIVYSWDFATVPPVGFDTGNGVFDGSVQRVKSLLVYCDTTPAAATSVVDVDNIRNGNYTAPVVPPAPQAKALLKGAAPGQAIFSWDQDGSTSVTGFEIYLATDANFPWGAPTPRNLPTTPTVTAGPSARTITLDGLAPDTNYYVSMVALNGEETSPRTAEMPIRLSGASAGTADRIVLGGDDFLPGSAGFLSNRYDYAGVYVAQALGGLGRSFESATAYAMEAGEAELSAIDNPVVIWSTLLDGAATPAISAPNLSKIYAYLTDGGNIVVSGTNVAQSLSANGSLESHFHAQLVNPAINLASVTPLYALAPAGPFSTSLNPTQVPVAYATSQNAGLRPVFPAGALARYTGLPVASGVAAVGYRNQSVVLGFAFETAGRGTDAATTLQARQQLMGGLIDYLLEPTAAHDWQLLL